MQWSVGTPQVNNSSDTNTLAMTGVGNAFTLTAPADTTPRTLIVYAGQIGASGTLTAHLSDSSAPDYVFTPAATFSYTDLNFTLTYSAGSPGKMLVVTWTETKDLGNGLITLAGAALAAARP